jgi:hypothetical protein
MMTMIKLLLANTYDAYWAACAKHLDYHLRTILVKAIRRNGKPHRQVLCLGGITASAILAKDERTLYWFWQKVAERLAAQAELTPQAPPRRKTNRRQGAVLDQATNGQAGAQHFQPSSSPRQTT